MIRSIPLPLTDVHEADAPIAIDDERRWPGDVEGREAETMIDTVLLHDRSVGVDQDRDGQVVGRSVCFNPLGTLADDHEYLHSQAVVHREMGLQLLQLLAAARSPGAADEHQDQRR
jgi:hypothetical protein